MSLTFDQEQARQRAEYERLYPGWSKRMMALLERVREGNRELQLAQRDSAAARLRVHDAKVELSRLDDQVREHRSKRPMKP